MSQGRRIGNRKSKTGASRGTVVWLQTNWKSVEANLGEIPLDESLRCAPAGMCSRRRSDSEMARISHASQILARPISSFNDLSQSEGDKLVLVYKQELGQEYKTSTGYQGARRKQAGRRSTASPDELLKLGEIAVELWHGEGEDWFQLLCARAMQRFRVPNPQSLTPGQARSMVEEMLQRIAVRECRKRHEPPITREEIEAEKEVWRKKFFRPQMAQISQSEEARPA